MAIFSKRVILSIVIISIIILTVTWLAIGNNATAMSWGVDLKAKLGIPISVLILILLNIRVSRLIKIVLRSSVVFLSLYGLFGAVGSELSCIDLGLSCPLLSYTNILKPLFLFLLIISFFAKKES